MRRRRKLPRSIRLPSRWRRGSGLIVTLVLISLAIAIDRSSWSPLRRKPVEVQPDAYNADDNARYHDRFFEVVHVVDGDTLDIDAPDIVDGKQKDRTRIRLWGVDSPEVAHGRGKDMHFGAEATAFAKETLAGRTVQVVLSPERTRDRYGRLLAYVFLDRGGPMFNEMLIEGGYAYADPRWNHHYESRFASAERRAREAQAGLWNGVKRSDMPVWRQKLEASRP